MPLYDGYLRKLSERFERALAEIEANHNFELGDEFEKATCKVLRRVLPGKFGVCRGYVVAADGEKAGDDIIIYDRLQFPTLRSLEDDQFGGLEYVPIEAVYAYIEAKHSLYLGGTGGQSISKALEQVAAVQRICAKRPSLGWDVMGGTHRLITKGTQVAPPTGLPPMQNPLFTAIISRNVRDKNGKLLEGAAVVSEGLGTIPLNQSQPDILVAGSDAVLIPVARTEMEIDGLLSPFYVANVNTHARYRTPGLAFGIGMSMLLWALDFIDLGRIRWSEIIVEGVNEGMTPTKR